MTKPTIWTIAYRKPTGPWFQRVDLELTWAQAFYLAGELAKARPDLVVYYTPNKAHDDARGGEDAHNILTDNDKRIAIKDTGKLPEGLTILSAEEAQERFSAGAR